MLQSLPVVTSPTTVQFGASHVPAPKWGAVPLTGSMTGRCAGGVGSLMRENYTTAIMGRRGWPRLSFLVGPAILPCHCQRAEVQWPARYFVPRRYSSSIHPPPPKHASVHALACDARKYLDTGWPRSMVRSQTARKKVLGRWVGLVNWLAWATGGNSKNYNTNTLACARPCGCV